MNHKNGRGFLVEATIRDVARESQLSVASVSRALNGHKSVRPETRERIVAVADRLGYVPHAGARSLSMACSNAIGVVLPDLHGEFFSEIVRGMDREATRLGLQLLLSNMHADPVQAGQALRAMHGRVDGLLIMCPQMHTERWAGSMPRGVVCVCAILWYHAQTTVKKFSSISDAPFLTGYGKCSQDTASRLDGC